MTIPVLMNTQWFGIVNQKLNSHTGKYLRFNELGGSCPWQWYPTVLSQRAVTFCLNLRLGCLGISMVHPRPKIQLNVTQLHHWKSCLATKKWSVQTLYSPLLGVLTRVTSQIPGSFCCPRFPLCSPNASQCQLSLPTPSPSIPLPPSLHKLVF